MDEFSGFQPFDNGLGDWTDFGVADPAYVDLAWAPEATFDATAGAFPMQDSHAIAFNPVDLQALPVPVPITRNDSPIAPRRRKQNRSCDQCRVSKKACDLTPPASSDSAQNEAPQTCGMCRSRGIECTSTWLDRKKRKERVAVAKRVARMTAQGSGESEPAPSLESMTIISEAGLGRPMIAQDVLARQLDLYVEAFEMPMAQCLIQGGLPPNCSHGLDALIHLRGGGHLNQISYQQDDWNSGSNAAEKQVRGAETVRKAALLFQATGLLDAIFQTGGTGVSPNRTASITEGYKWVAVATAAQYCFSLGDEADLRSRDLAYTSFQRAKDAVFGNMAASQSFRHALSMLLFGIVTPPGTGEEKSTQEEDTTYAFHEGARRLQRLCAGARKKLEKKEGRLSSDARLLVSEMLFAVQWLVDLVYTSFWRTPTTGSSVEHDTISPDRICADAEETMATRANDTSVSFMETWNKKEIVNWGNDRLDDGFFSDARGLASVTVLLWKRVKRLQAAIEADSVHSNDVTLIASLYSKALSAVRLWRKVFGGIDPAAELHFGKAASSMVWRTFALCSNDADFAILLFCETAKRLQDRLLSTSDPSFDSLLKLLNADAGELGQQRLVSAIRVSMVAATSHAREAAKIGESRFGSIQNIVIHPYPLSITQIYALVIKALEDQMENVPQAGTSSKSTRFCLLTCSAALENIQRSLHPLSGL